VTVTVTQNHVILFSMPVFCAALLWLSAALVNPRPTGGRVGAARAGRGTMSAMQPSDVLVVMNGLPGAMGVEVAEACLRRGMRLAPFGLTGPRRSGESIEVAGPDGERHAVRLVPGPTGTSAAAAECEAVGAELAALAAGGGRVVCIDYTHPSAVNANAAWYARHGLAFVMGTTGGDRAALEATVTSTPGLYAVIAPNMAKQIVALQVGLARQGGGARDERGKGEAAEAWRLHAAPPGVNGMGRAVLARRVSPARSSRWPPCCRLTMSARRPRPPLPALARPHPARPPDRPASRGWRPTSRAPLRATSCA
jgi:hypothetical protein